MATFGAMDCAGRQDSEMTEPPSVVFLPGAGGSAEFWKPVAGRLPTSWQTTLLGWPGAGDQPHDPRVACFEDLIELADSQFCDRSDLVAQSMGGVVALGLALRNSEKIRRLVLVATSGGSTSTGSGQPTGERPIALSSHAPPAGSPSKRSTTRRDSRT